MKEQMPSARMPRGFWGKGVRGGELGRGGEVSRGGHAGEGRGQEGGVASAKDSILVQFAGYNDLP